MGTPTNCFGILHAEGPPSAAGSVRPLSTIRMKINFGFVPGSDIINTYCRHTCENCTFRVDIQSPNQLDNPQATICCKFYLI